MDDMSEDEYVAWQVRIANAVRRVTVPGGSFFYNHKLRYRDMTMLHPLDIVRQFGGWKIRQEIIWDRCGSMVMNARMFAPSDERVYWLVRDDGDFSWNQEAASWLTVWKITPERGIEGHPCPYPAQLVKRCIAAVTNKGDTVMDPFLGSGTTAEAAYDMGRRFVGFEVNEKYMPVIQKRLSQQRFAL